MTTVPPIPTRLAGRPTVAGLVVPWISVTHSTGHALGAVHHCRRDACLRDRLCQTCGGDLGPRAVLFVRPADVRAGYAPEPAMHPECAAYSAAACPMLTGHMDHYRRQGVQIPGADCECGGRISSKDANARAGADAEKWDAWWINPHTWPLVSDSSARLLGVALGQMQPLKVRPLRASAGETAMRQFVTAAQNLLDHQEDTHA